MKERLKKVIGFVLGLLASVYDSFVAGVKKNPATSIFGLLIAVCTGLSQVDQLRAYSTMFACASGVFTAMLAACAGDAKKESSPDGESP